MKFQKAISFLFHPILLPFAGTLYYFLITPLFIPKTAQKRIILLILVTTYFIPLLLLFLLKKTKKIDNFRIEKIEQRKRPLIFIISIFGVLCWIFLKIPQLSDLGILFLGTVLSFLCMFFLFQFRIKTSIHMFGIGTFVGFILVFSYKYQIEMLNPLITLIIVSGLIGRSRLYLKAHTLKEVNIGFLLGVLSQVMAQALYFCYSI